MTPEAAATRRAAGGAERATVTRSAASEVASTAEPGITLVGVGALLFRDGKVLLGERRGSHGAGSWAPPGGHLAYGEAPESCARREVAEETGLAFGAAIPGPYSVDVFPDVHRQYVTLFVLATEVVGEPVLREPARCAGWAWWSWEALPAPLFAPLASLVATGYTPPWAGGSRPSSSRASSSRASSA